MKTKPLTFLLSLTFLFLFSGSPVVFGDDFQDGFNAAHRGDFKTAYSLLLPLAEQGHASAQFNLGFMYAYGGGVLQDYKEAVKWFRLSAEQGNASAQFNLGFMYASGKGVPKDYKEALRFLRLSAKQGYAKAQNYLSFMYYKGLGIPKDYVLAHMWLNLAISNGIEGKVKNRDGLEKKMSPQQIEKAQEMARNWKPTKK
jgi:TPR repeat protein